MPNPYDEVDNFTSRLRVETTYPDKVIDHRTREFYDREYKRNMQDKPLKNEGRGFPDMNSVTEAPKPKAGTKRVRTKKTTDDQSVIDANQKDLKSRNIK